MRRPTRLAWTRRSKAARPADIRSAVVAQVKSQAAQAEDLAAIPGQDRLADPRLNPAVRAEVDRLRNEQQRSGLRFEHTRVLRRHRVADSRAAEAEVTLEAIALARQTASPARSVLALYQGRRLYRRITLAASVCLAAGSAMGVEAAARALGAHAGTGYIAEIGATGLSTFAIGYYAHLRENGATFTRKVIEKDGTEVTVARCTPRSSASRSSTGSNSPRGYLPFSIPSRMSSATLRYSPRALGLMVTTLFGWTQYVVHRFLTRRSTPVLLTM